jgi:hypothetical protein
VARDFVSFPVSARDDLRMFRDVLANYEERCFDMPRSK